MPPITFSLLASLASLLLRAPPALSACECGYLIPETSSLFTHALVSDFSRSKTTKSVSAMRERLTNWTIQSWTGPGSSEDLFGTEDFRLPRINLEQNVWFEDGSLRLRQNGYSEGDFEERKAVRVAEIVAEEEQVLYGSFRSEFKVVVPEGTEGGACAGFFYYFDDESEIDIEIITSDDSHSVHYTRHLSGISNSTKEYLRTPFTTFQEHRFDWTPSGLHFYQNGVKMKSLPGAVPKQPGHIHINLWADDSEWTGKPANKDVEMWIRYSALYYNTSNSHVGEDVAWQERCEEARGREDAVCVLEEGRDQLVFSKEVVGSRSWKVGAELEGVGVMAIVSGILLMI